MCNRLVPTQWQSFQECSGWQEQLLMFVQFFTFAKYLNIYCLLKEAWESTFLTSAQDNFHVYQSSKVTNNHLILTTAWKMALLIIFYRWETGSYFIDEKLGQVKMTSHNKTMTQSKTSGLWTQFFITKIKIFHGGILGSRDWNVELIFLLQDYSWHHRMPNGWFTWEYGRLIGQFTFDIFRVFSFCTVR